MFQQGGEPLSRKRGREGDDEFTPQGFQEHRIKRHITCLPLRQSPEYKKRALLSFQPNCVAPQSPTLADITPAGSDSEDVSLVNEPRSFFSPWSSDLDSSLQSSQPSSGLNGSQPTQMQDAQDFSDDLEMTDSGPLLPGIFHTDPFGTTASRIPTPIYSQFSHVHSGGKDGPDVTLRDQYHYNDTGANPSAARNSRRLPSPISEDEAVSPSCLLQSLGDVQMEGEECTDTITEDVRVIPKKGHTRSKHSLRNWGGFGAEIPGMGVRRGFTMGYRSDCEKCRMRVPGHFSHVMMY